MDPYELHHVHGNWIEAETVRAAPGAKPERVYTCTKPGCGWTFRRPAAREES